MIDDREQREDENRDAQPLGPQNKDFLDRGVRVDPNLPPMTDARPEARPQTEREHESTAVPEHDTVLPRPDPRAGHLGAEDVARLVGRDADQQDATKALDAVHDREDTSES